MNKLKQAIRQVRSAMPELKLLLDEPMKNHCSFRIGGPVAAMAMPSSAEEAEYLGQLLLSFDIEPFVMGNGTNLLVSDAPLDLFVIQMGDAMSEIRREGENRLVAQSGVTLARLAMAAQSYGLSGLEFAHGIPGSLGGAVAMNAGAYGGEMKDVVIQTDFLDSEMERFSLKGAKQKFGYRHSAFSDCSVILLESTLELTPGDPAEISARMKELAEKRRNSQPLDMPSAGSTFKRPVGGYAAALIDEAGLKGYTVGGAKVSEKHAGFVVNAGGATFDDVLTLMEHIQETVYRNSGIELEPEVKIIE